MNDFLCIHENSPIRFPFVMIDRVVSVTTESIHTRKNVVLNEWFMAAHYQDFPVMPAPLMIEAMAQSGLLLFQHAMASSSASSGFFSTPPADQSQLIAVLAGIERVKARAPVYPGSVLEIHVRFVSVRVRARQRYAKLFGEIFVEGRQVLQGFFKTSAMDVDR